MTTQSTAETATTDNGTEPETGENAGTDTNGKPAETEGDTGTGSEPTEEDGRLKHLRGKLDETTAKLRKMEEAEAERARAEMSEMDRLKADLEIRDAELTELKVSALRSRIATEHGLPAELAERLKGTTAEELTEDAARLAELVPAKRNPPPPAGDAGIGGRAQPTTTDPRELHRSWTK